MFAYQQKQGNIENPLMCKQRGRSICPYNVPLLLCFTLYLEAISRYKSPGGLYLEGRFNGGFFALPVLRGLYLEGLIHGGAYFRNFTVVWD